VITNRQARGFDMCFFCTTPLCAKGRRAIICISTLAQGSIPFRNLY